MFSIFKKENTNKPIHPLMIKILSFLVGFAILTSSPFGFAFDKPLASQTTRSHYPHILKTNVFELNTRNVKALKQYKNDLWIGTSMGAIRYSTDSHEDYEIFDNQSGLLSNGIFNIVIAPNGSPWIGTYGGGVSFLKNGKWININTPQGLCDAFVYDVKFSGQDTWIATWSGANRVRGNILDRSSWKSYTKENTNGGLIDNWVYAIELGKNGDIWFGTESGISSYDGKLWRSWNHKNGLSASYSTVEQDNTGTVDYLQGEHHSGHNSAPTQSSSYRPDYVVSMLMDKKERLWVGSWGGGLTQLDTKTKTTRVFTVKEGLPGNYVLALKEGPDGNLWIGTNKGLSRFDGKTFTNFSTLNGLSGNYIFSLEFGPDDSIWTGTHYAVDQFWRIPKEDDFRKLQ